jgi:hypothetical protein
VPDEARPERPPGQGGPRPNRSRNRRRREGAPGEAAAPGEQRQAESPERGERRERGPREGGDRGDRSGRDPRRRDDRGGGGRGGRGRDGGRDSARRPERKLYNVDSVVDRGFEDVEEEEGGERRVHWTIVKRTVADQISRKAMSTAYVLQRDGAETEFPSLGSARSAVNKTIVHPEKLTLSKADHAAAKTSR